MRYAHEYLRHYPALRAPVGGFASFSSSLNLTEGEIIL